MPARRHPIARSTGLALALTFVVLACGSTPAPTATGSPEGSPAADPSSAASTPPAEGPVVPIACMSLGAVDCRRVADLAMATVAAEAGRVIYLQVGPFGCANGQAACATTLQARPEGDVIIELEGVPAIGVHVRVVEGAPAVERSEVFGIVLGSTSQPPVSIGPHPFELGHCGLWSGIDHGGSWWDPVGPIDVDHPDAINATGGVMTINDPDHATFVSDGGLVVQLSRRDGPKHLPLCR